MKGNRSIVNPLAVAAVIGVLACAVTQADIINFDTNPSLPKGPSLFSQAGASVPITADGVTFTGGVILGDATNLFSPFVTAPNVYGTADSSSGADPSLKSVIDLVINSSVDATSVEGVLFNGKTAAETYTIDGYAGNALVDSQVFTDIPSNTNSGSEEFTMTSTGPALTLITITPTLDAGSWDYVIDTVAVNESINDAVPEPSTYGELGLGVALLVFWSRRRAARA